MTFESQTARFYFRSYRAAARALMVVLLDARDSEFRYRFTGLTPGAIIRGGLLVEGEIQAVSEKLMAIPGTTRGDS